MIYRTQLIAMLLLMAPLSACGDSSESTSAPAAADQDRIDANTADIAMLQEQVAGMRSMNATLDQLRNELTTAQMSLSTAQDDIEALKIGKANSTALATIETDLSTVESGLGAVQTDLSTVRMGLNTVETDLTLVQSGLGTVQSDLTTVETDLSTTQSSLNTVQTGLGSVQADLNTVEAGLSVAQNSVGTVQMGLAAVENRVVSVETGLTSAETSLVAVETGLASVETNLATVETGLASVETSLTTLETDLTTVEDNVTDVQHALDVTKREIDVVEADVASVQMALDATKRELDVVEADVSGVQGDLDTVEVNLSEVDTRLAEDAQTAEVLSLADCYARGVDMLAWTGDLDKALNDLQPCVASFTSVDVYRGPVGEGELDSTVSNLRLWLGFLAIDANTLSSSQHAVTNKHIEFIDDSTATLTYYAQTFEYKINGDLEVINTHHVDTVELMALTGEDGSPTTRWMVTAKDIYLQDDWRGRP